MKLPVEDFALTIECVMELLENRVGYERTPTKDEISLAKKDTYILFSQLENYVTERVDLQEYSGDNEELCYFLGKYIK